MTVSKAQQKSVQKYVRANYDRLDLTLPKGQKEVIKAYSTAIGKSVNSFVADAVTAALNGAASDTGECVVTPESYAKAAEHIKGTEESISDFVSRAIADTIARDEMLRRLK